MTDSHDVLNDELQVMRWATIPLEQGLALFVYDDEKAVWNRAREGDLEAELVALREEIEAYKATIKMLESPLYADQERGFHVARAEAAEAEVAQFRQIRDLLMKALRRAVGDDNWEDPLTRAIKHAKEVERLREQISSWMGRCEELHGREAASALEARRIRTAAQAAHDVVMLGSGSDYEEQVDRAMWKFWRLR